MAKFTPKLILASLAAVTSETPPKGSVLENDIVLDVVDHLAKQLDFPDEERLYRIVRARLGEDYSIVRRPPIRWWHTLNTMDYLCAERRSSFLFMSEGGTPLVSIQEIARGLAGHFPEYETEELEPIVRRHLMRKRGHVIMRVFGDTAWYATKEYLSGINRLPQDEAGRPE
jgi:hypothetical protein